MYLNKSTGNALICEIDLLYNFWKTEANFACVQKRLDFFIVIKNT